MVLFTTLCIILVLVFSGLHLTVQIGSESPYDNKVPCQEDSTNGDGCAVSEVSENDLTNTIRQLKINAFPDIVENDLTDPRDLINKDTDFIRELGQKHKKINKWQGNLFRDPAASAPRARNNQAKFKMMNLKFRDVLSSVAVLIDTADLDLSTQKRRTLAKALNDVTSIVKGAEQASIDQSMSDDKVISVYRTRARLLSQTVDLVIEAFVDVVDVTVTALTSIVSIAVETVQSAVEILFQPSPTIRPTKAPGPKAPKAPLKPPNAPLKAPIIAPQPQNLPTFEPSISESPTDICTDDGFPCVDDIECCTNYCGSSPTPPFTCYCLNLGDPCFVDDNCCAGTTCVGGFCN